MNKGDVKLTRPAWHLECRKEWLAGVPCKVLAFRFQKTLKTVYYAIMDNDKYAERKLYNTNGVMKRYYKKYGHKRTPRHDRDSRTSYRHRQYYVDDLSGVPKKILP